MKQKALLILTFILFIAGSVDAQKKVYKEKKANNVLEIVQDGDIIFQETNSDQCEAIRQATKSRYTHCGIIYKIGEKVYVYEAVQPVISTPIQQWIDRGVDRHYVVKRLKNADEVLTLAIKRKMQEEAIKHDKKDYDLRFGWSDDTIYCSELVWKIYKRGANVEVGKLQKLGDFDLSHPAVLAKIKERYGNRMPLEELAISPGAIFDSELLITVPTN